MSHSTPVVYFVDEDASARGSFAEIVHGAGLGLRCFGSAAEFLSQPRALVPSCLVLEVNLRDLHGLELQARVAAQGFEMPIVFFTNCQDIGTTVRAMKAGAFEYLPKTIEVHHLLGVVRKALDRSAAALVAEAELAILRERLCSLTRREREVLALVVSGRLNKQVGGDLGISEITVKAHRGKVMRKMRAVSFVHLISMAARLRLAVPMRAYNRLGVPEAREVEPVRVHMDDVPEDNWLIAGRSPAFLASL